MLALPRHLTKQTMDEVQAHLTHADGPIVFEGGSCLGLDFVGLEESDFVDSPYKQANALFEQLLTGPQPVLCLVDGSCTGLGLGMLGVSDVVLATFKSRFALPDVLMGLSPALVMPYLARRIGWVHARRLALDGGSITARDAKQLGLIDDYAEDIQPLAEQTLSAWRRACPVARAAVRSAEPGDASRATNYIASDASLRSSVAQTRIRRFLGGKSPWPKQ